MLNKDMDYVLDLTTSKKAFGAHSRAVLRNQIIGVPSVPHPFCFTPRAFNEYLATNTFSEEFILKLKEVYKNITVDGYKANIRTMDVECPEFPSLSYKVSISYNIQSFGDFFEAFEYRFKVIKETVIENNIKDVQVSGLLTVSYDSMNCGLIQTNDGYGNIRIEAALGQNTNIISREGIDADVYILSSDGTKIISKYIGVKDREFLFAEKGLKIVPIEKKRQKLQAFSDEQILKFGEYARKLQDTYGPQEFECAITTKGLQLVQDSRDMDIINKGESLDEIEIIYPNKVTGTVINVSKIADLPNNCSNSIIIIHSLDLDLLTLLIFKYKPVGVILKVGTLTSHASTILREAKIPSYINKNIDIQNEIEIQLNENGSYEIHY